MRPIVLLHGALGSDRQVERLKTELEQKFKVFTLCFEGHGSRNSERPLRIEHFSENLRDFLEENNLVKPIVFGYSMGGYVAIYTEAMFPNSFEKIITLGTKFSWTPGIAAREVRMLQPEIIEEKVPKFAAHLDQMHAPNDWKAIMNATAEMMENMGENPSLDDVELSQIVCPVVLMLGGKDNMVSHAETDAIKTKIPNAEFHSFENFEHPMEKVDLSVLGGFICDM